MQNKNIFSVHLDKQIAIHLFCLVLLGWYSTYQLEQYMDVLLWDEAIYLNRSYLLWKTIPNTWGPIYSVWYKLLSYIEINKVELYYLNYKIQTIGSACLLYFFLVRYKVSNLVSFFFALMWLIHLYNLPSWPKISHFCISIVLISGIISSYFSSKLIQTIIFSFAFLCCGYARPELYLSFILSLFFILYFLIKERNNLKTSHFLSLFVLFVFILFSYKLYKTPFNNNDSQRSVGVFIQHFAYNYSTWHKSNILWWYEWKAIIANVFGDELTFKQIVLEKNGMFFKHIFFNLQLFIKYVSLIIVNIFFPISFFAKKPFFFILISIVSMLFFVKNIETKNNIKQQFKINKYLLLMLLIASVPSSISSIYAHPREHYLVMLIPLIFILLALCFKSVEFKIKYSIVLFLIFAFLMPKAKDHKYFDMYGTNNNMTNIKTIKHIEKQYKQDSLTIFDADGMLPTLMTENFKIYDFKQLIIDDTLYISDLMHKKQPDIIFVSPTMLRWSKIKEDTMFQQLINAPEKYHYRKENIAGLNEAYLLIKFN
jgi:hypothetical protein